MVALLDRITKNAEMIGRFFLALIISLSVLSFLARLVAAEMNWKVGVLVGAASLLLAFADSFFRFREQSHINNKSGVCRHCGYDLRATPDRCPECGTLPTKKDITLS